ncbi:MAG TPA: dihydrodipicolinate synthase family protein [Synergistales bacterium]|nr:MAG: Dihydrodipicolinate synthase [Synergistales bacterium 57_84]KUK88289.1 MAG: Dihydrodipicolinate synthase [Synergistales bacterium 58_81]HQQ10041.1 dihydrodipicolinate synthase family protein [Synergistales bacterium]
MELKGIYAPIPTPFNDDGDLDLDALSLNFDKWLRTPLDGIVASGSNGEWPLLGFAERAALFGACADLSRGRLKVIAGIHCPSTKESLDLGIEAARAGCDAVLVLPPHYYKGQNSREGLLAYFRTIADSVRLPVVLYNMPSNTGFNLVPDIVATLSEHPNIIGIKDSSGDIVQIASICRDTPEEFGVFAGSGSFFLPSLAVGCSGGTMGVANLFADACRDIFLSFRKGDLERSRSLQLSIIEMNQAVTKRFGVPGLKAAMDHAGLYGGPVRPPLLPVEGEVREEIGRIYDCFRSNYREVSP